MRGGALALFATFAALAGCSSDGRTPNDERARILSSRLGTAQDGAVIFPERLLTRTGKVNTGFLGSLRTPDGVSDGAWGTYLEFFGKRSGYAGEFIFPVSPSADLAALQKIRLQAVYRGSLREWLGWRFEIFANDTGEWLPVGDNGPALDWAWTQIELDVPGAPARFLDANREIRIRYSSERPGDDSDLDFLALVLAGLPPQLEPAPPPPAIAGGSVYPLDLRTRKGWQGETGVYALGVQDQSGTDDVYGNYVELTSDPTYAGEFRFEVPSTVDLNAVGSIAIETNFRGSESGWELWTFELKDYTTGAWVGVGDNAAAPQWKWTPLSFEVRENFRRFIGPDGAMAIRYASSGNKDASDLDQLSIKLGGVTTAPFLAPPVPRAEGKWYPQPGTKWQLQYSGTMDYTIDADAYHVDLFDTPTSAIDQLHAQGRHVICYFDAGTWEQWRPDAKDFPASVLGARLRDWPEERELDIRSQDVLRPIMAKRMDLAVAKHCDSVSPDNMEVYLIARRFKATYLDQLTYNVWVANEAHARGLTVGLRNDVEHGAMLASYFDWTLVEGCIENGGCDSLDRFTAADKAVFGIEYNLDPASFCPIANGKNYDFQKKHILLDAWRETCR